MLLDSELAVGRVETPVAVEPSGCRFAGRRHAAPARARPASEGRAFMTTITCSRCHSLVKRFCLRLAWNRTGQARQAAQVDAVF